MFAEPEFWVAIAFFGFVALVLYYRVPQQAISALDARAEQIASELDEARRLREEAQALLADYERKGRDAEKEAAEILAQAQREAEILAQETRKKFEDTIARRTRMAQDKIARAKAQALSDVRSQTIEVAIAAARSLIDKKLTAAAASKLVDMSISGLKGKLN
jgi:F-type H+-transporting ATPase subunit b